MATEARWFAVTIPAGTAKAAPQTADITSPAMLVERITVRVPPGPSGLMGFRLTVNGEQVIPLNLGAWIVTDDQVLDWALGDLPNSGAWQVTGYNTGTYDHTIYLDFELSPLSSSASAAASSAAAEQAVTTATLAASGGGTGG